MRTGPGEGLLRPVPGGKSAATLYKTLRTAGGLSLVECELLTGRTHQIRAQFAAAGHPLLGDGKYGRERDNKKYGRSFQASIPISWPSPFPPTRAAGVPAGPRVHRGAGGFRGGILSHRGAGIKSLKIFSFIIDIFRKTYMICFVIRAYPTAGLGAPFTTF